MLQTLEPLLYTKSFWLVTLLTSIFIYLKFVVNNRWKRRGVPHEAPYVLVGNALSICLKQSSIGTFARQSYEKFGKHPYHGLYMFYKPFLMINDPELIRLILIKEFSHFQDRGFYHNDEVDPLTNNLFFLPGKKWKVLREKITPAFTSGKLKQMFPLIREVGEELAAVCDETTRENEVIDVKDMTGRYTADTICTIAYGFKNSSLRDADNAFKHHGELVFRAGGLRYALSAFAPGVMRFFRVSFMPSNVIDFFVSTFEHAVQLRRESKVDRKDFLGLVMQLMDRGVLKDDDGDESLADKDVYNTETESKVSFREALAQPYLFFGAGYETTSSAISYCLYELALNQQVQEKLRDEVDKVVSKDGGLKYESVMNEMEYLNMVFQETLRKYSSLPILNRECVQDFVIPSSNLKIKKGEGILISINGIHYNPDYYPDPEKFDPQRFTKENVAGRNPYTYLPFGCGPRSCIGNRYGILQFKMALIYLLSRFNLSTCEETMIPLRYSMKTLVQTPDGPLYLRIQRRENC